MTSEFYSNVLLVSTRQDVIVYCKRNLPEPLQIAVASNLSNCNLDLYPIILYDASSAASDEKECLLDINNKLTPKIQNVVFLIANIVSDRIRNMIYSITQNIIPYPCTSRIYKNIINHIFYENKNESFTKKSEIPALGSISKEEELIKQTILGESDAMKNVRNRIICYSQNDDPVLLLGESGTG